MAFDKKTAYTAAGALAGGAGLYFAGTMIDKTDYAQKDPNSAYTAKLAAAGGAAVLGVVALAMRKPVIGAVLLVGGGGMAAEAYSAHESYLKATAPPSAVINPGGGLPQVVIGGTPINTPSGGLPVTVEANRLGVSQMPLSLPQSAGAMRLQSGAAARVGMQSGAAARVGMR